MELRAQQDKVIRGSFNVDVLYQCPGAGLIDLGCFGDELPAEVHELDDSSSESDSCKDLHTLIAEVHKGMQEGLIRFRKEEGSKAENMYTADW